MHFYIHIRVSSSAVDIPELEHDDIKEGPPHTLGDSESVCNPRLVHGNMSGDWDHLLFC